MYLHLEKKSLA
uniref:Uncharacterized protein n=1 Tax=Arundo donax TaxID=35708 RepID=A0A0A9HWM5_ARUDO